MTRAVPWLTALAALPVLLVVLLGAPSPAQASATCTATATLSPLGDTGGVVTVTVTNTRTTTAARWTMVAEYPDTASITSYWGGTLTSPDRIGTLDFKNTAWNGTLRAGAKAEVGFLVTVPAGVSPSPVRVDCTMIGRQALP